MQTAGEALLPLSQVVNLGAVLAACAAIVISARRERTAALRIFVELNDAAGSPQSMFSRFKLTEATE